MRQIGVSLLLATFAFVAHAAPKFVDLTADLEITSWGSSPYDDPPMFESTLWKIRCVIGTNSWLITASNQPSSTYAWHYTGSNLVRQIPTDKATRPSTRTIDFNGDPDSVQNGELFSSAFRIPWLAFCSGPFLTHPQIQIPLPSLTWKWSLYSDYNSPPVGFQNNIVRFEDDLGLPISIDVLSKTGHPILQYRAQHGRVASPASTNIAGWQFPLEFRAIQYAPIRTRTNSWQADLVAHGKITSIKIGATPNLSHSSVHHPAPSAPRNVYVLRAGGPAVYNELTNSPALNNATITLRNRQDTPGQISFAITNNEPEEILIWNVRVQVKSFGESPGTDGFGWDTVYDDYPEVREAALDPGRSTDLRVTPPDGQLWRVCVLYSKHHKDKLGPKTYDGNYEVISQPIDEATLENLSSPR
jgi:hypothetical protein